MLCAIWYNLYNSKNVKSTHGRVLLLVKLQAKVFNFNKNNTPPWLFFTFLNWVNGAKLRKASHLDFHLLLKNHWFGLTH